MASATISDSTNRLEDMEGTPTVISIGAGAAGGQETVTFYQGLASVNRKVTNTAERGTGVTTASTVDMTAADDNRVLLSKTFISDYLDINAVGWRTQVGNTNGDYYFWILWDDGTLGDRDISELFPRGGWYITAIEADEIAWRDGSVGTPDITIADSFLVSCGLANGNAKSDNLFIDAIDLGDGLYLIGGDTGTIGTWELFLIDDQGTPTAGRFGHMNSNATGYEALGKFVIGRNASGTSTLTDFLDEVALAITWPGGRVGAGWNELEYDCATANTEIVDNNKTFSGAGRDNLKRFFDTDHQVDDVNEELDIVGHGFETGDHVTYSDEGGTETPGPTDGVDYWIEAVTVDAVSLHTTRANAYTGTSPVNLTASTSGNGENHSLRRRPDTRPDFTVTGTASGATALNDACKFVRFSDCTWTSAYTASGCTFERCNTITLGGGDMDTCVVLGHTTVEGESFCDGSATEVAAINDTAFTQGDTGGHAIEITSGSGTLSAVGITFSGYGNDPSGNGQGMVFNPSTDLDDGNDEIDYVAHGFASGDAVYYSNRDPADGTAGTSVTGLTDGGLYYVRAVTVDAISFHVTRYAAENNLDKIAISGATNEDHSVYSADAAVVNSTGNAIVWSVSSGGTTPSVRNVGASTTTVSNDVSITIDTDGITNFEARVFLQGTKTVVAETQDNGATDTWVFSVGSGVAVDIDIMKIASPSPQEFFRKENITFTATSTFAVSLRLDKNSENYIPA